MWSSPGYDVRYTVAILCFVIGILELSPRCNNCPWGWGAFIAEYISLISEHAIAWLHTPVRAHPNFPRENEILD